MRTISFVLLLIVAGSLAAQSETAHSEKLSGKQAELFKSVSDDLICQCGCNLVLTQCGHVNCPSAVPMREKIEEMVLAGKTKQEMLSYFMNEYSFRGKPPVGKAILSQPDTKGFDLMAWLMPFVLFVVFLGVVVYVVKKISGRTVEKPVAVESPAEMDPRIEEELKKFES
ncbi:cytochrome c-type biogenesis protein CcmH [bacterium]|nr:cytochrome c-type biogenesis protein CcmH [bacterium]